MKPGLLVLDKSDAILLTNASLETIVHTRNIEGEKYWKIFKEPKLFELVQKALSDR